MLWRGMKSNIIIYKVIFQMNFLISPSELEFENKREKNCNVNM